MRSPKKLRMNIAYCRSVTVLQEFVGNSINYGSFVRTEESETCDNFMIANIACLKHPIMVFHIAVRWTVTFIVKAQAREARAVDPSPHFIFLLLPFVIFKLEK